MDETREERNGSSKALGIILFGFILLILLMAFSITKGATNIPMTSVIDGLFHFNRENQQHLVIIDLRLPRVVASALVGSALAVSGAIMQGITHNPLADPGIMGINAGAGFMLSISFAFFPTVGYMNMILISFLGAVLGAILVNSVASTGRKENSINLVLAGVAINTLLVALSQGIALMFNVSQNIMFWTVGGVAGSNWQQIKIMTPWIILAHIGGIIISKSISTLSLGDDVAKGLGLNTKVVYILSSIIVLILAGASVSVIGSVGFVGLIVPHIARFFVGLDYKWIIPTSAVLGAILMVLADLGSRIINPPFETPIGAIISLIGVPFFLYLSCKEGRNING